MSKKAQNKKIKVGNMTFDVVNTTILVIVLLIVLYPLYYVLIASFSNPDLVLTGKIFLLPKGFQTESYERVFSNPEIMQGYLNSILYTLVGTCINLAVTLWRLCSFQAGSKGTEGIHDFFYLYYVFRRRYSAYLYAG